LKHDVVSDLDGFFDVPYIMEPKPYGVDFKTCHMVYYIFRFLKSKLDSETDILLLFAGTRPTSRGTMLNSKSYTAISVLTELLMIP